MANGIFIPPWMKGVEPGELARLHATGLELGQRAAAQQTQALMAMQEAQQRQQEAATRASIAQQEIELETQKQSRMAQQFEQEIELKRQEEGRMAQVSAMRFAGGRKYQDTLAALTQQGMNPDDARQQALLAAAPDMMAQAPGEAMTAIRQSMPIPKPTVGTFDAGSKIPPALIDARGIPHWPPGSGGGEWDEKKLGEAKTVIDPSTGKPVGLTVRRGLNSASFVARQDLTSGDRLELQDLYAQKRKTQDSLAEAEDRLSASDPKKSPKTYETTTKQIDRLTKKQADIEDAIKSLRGSKTPIPAAPSAASASPDGPRVTTKAEYDALESGAVYVGKDGKRYRKP